MNNLLLINLELCEKYEACDAGLIFISKYYPEGFTVDDVINGKVRHIPKDFVIWAYENLPFSDYEDEQCLNYLNIVNSRGVRRSQNIGNSNGITGCKYIYDSENVWNSAEVEKSFEVYSSRQIINSKHINRSTSIKNSKHIKFSNEIIDSSYITKSTNVNNSFAIYDSRNLYKCYFCSSLVDQKNRLFCSKNTEHEYAIFNEKVSEVVFNEAIRILLKIVYKNMDVDTISHHDFLIEDKETWQEVKDSLPFYDELIAYEITLDENAFNID